MLKKGKDANRNIYDFQKAMSKIHECYFREAFEEI